MFPRFILEREISSFNLVFYYFHLEMSKAEMMKKKREEKKQQRQKEIEEKRAARQSSGALKLGTKKLAKD